MDNQQATPFEVGWMMAFLEGEGSIGLYWNDTRKQIFPVSIFVNTEAAIIEEASRVLKLMGIAHYVRRHKVTKAKPHWKQRTDIVVSGIKRCQKLTDTLLPYWATFTIKRQKAVLVREFCYSRLSHPVPEDRRYTGRYTFREHEILKEFNALKGSPQRLMSIPLGNTKSEDIVHPAVKIGEYKDAITIEPV